jgi:VWFA-related protein
MRFGRQRQGTWGKNVWTGTWAGGLAVGLMIAGAGQASARMAPVQTPGAQQQSAQNVPNAPTPQTLPQLNTITPVGPNAPVGAGASASSDNTDNGGVTPGSTLPATAPTASQTAAQAKEDQEQGPPPVAHAAEIHIYTNFVQVPFTVKDSKNRQVPGLTARDVRIYEDGVRQPVRLFTTDPYPLSVALVLDQSVTFDTMRKINDSLSALQGAFAPYDEVAVFTYANGVVKQTGFTAAQSARLGAILERSKGEGEEPMMGLTGPLAHGPVINNAPIDGVNTPGQVQGSMQINPPRQIHTLLDAIFAAAQETTKVNDPTRRRIVYVVSDGKEYGSTIKERDLIKYLQTNKIEVWATLVGDSSLPGLGFMDRIHLPLTMRDDVLPRITTATGGQTDPEFRPRGIQNSFAKITEEVRTQYTIGYYTHISPFNERFRSIDVRVLRPGLTVIAEPGYYPSASDSRPPATANPPVPPPTHGVNPVTPPATH